MAPLARNWQSPNCQIKLTPPGEAQNVKYVRIGQMNTVFGVGTAAKFDSGA